MPHVALRFVVLLASVGAFACSASPGVAPLGDDTAASTDGHAPDAGPSAPSSPSPQPRDPLPPGAACHAGDRKACKVVLSRHGGVTTCFAGEQVCSGGAWLDCGNPGPTTAASDLTFVAECPGLSTPRWRHLAYAIDAPSNASGTSRVKITVQTAPGSASAAGEYRPAAPVTLVDVPRDPSICSVDAVGCARDVSALLGEALASQTTLRLRVTRTQTPDATGTPEVATVTPVYDCVGAP